MIDSQSIVTDAQLESAYRLGRHATIVHIDQASHRAALRVVAESVIAAVFASREHIAPLPAAIDRLTAAIERLPNG